MKTIKTKKLPETASPAPAGPVVKRRTRKPVDTSPAPAVKAPRARIVRKADQAPDASIIDALRGAQDAPTTYWRVSDTRKLRGKLLFAYTLAVFDILGLTRGKAVEAAKITAFYCSASVIQNHIQADRMIRLADAGEVKLTDIGKAYFQNRLNGGSSQSVKQEVFDCIKNMLRTGKVKGTGCERSMLEKIQIQD